MNDIGTLPGLSTMPDDDIRLLQVKEGVMQRKVQEAEERELVRMGVERVVVACVGLEEGEGHCV